MPCDKDGTGNWQGHRPATSAALLDVMIAATTGSAKVSRAGRILFTACEFWASVRNHTLLGQLEEHAMPQLAAAEAAFIALALPKAATVVRDGRIALAASPGSLPQVVDTIEKLLEEVDAPIDQAISEFALKQGCHQ